MTLNKVHPFFSILIPVYNSALTLDQCLVSILSQNFDDYEVICVDDGSDDSSWSILGSYSAKDTRIHPFTQTNAGPSSARNKALKEANGEYILFVDSDDYLNSNSALSILFETITSNNGCELVYYAGAFVSSEGTYYDDSKQYKIYDFGFQCMEDNCLNSKGLVFGSISQQCFKSELPKKYNISFNEQLFYGEDRLFVCTLFHHAKKTVVIPDILYCYVIGNSTSLMHDEKRLTRKKTDIIKVVYQLDSLLQETEHKQTSFKKYVHGLYVQCIKGMNHNDVDMSLLFRNASTLRLLVKDILFYFRLFHYHL